MQFFPIQFLDDEEKKDLGTKREKKKTKKNSAPPNAHNIENNEERGTETNHCTHIVSLCGIYIADNNNNNNERERENDL